MSIAEFQELRATHAGARIGTGPKVAFGAINDFKADESRDTR